MFDVFIYCIYGLFAFVCIFPFYYIVINTISNNEMVASGLVLFFPRGIHFDNYFQVFQIKGIYSAAFISLSRTVVGTLISVLSASFIGYAMTKREYWHRKFWYRFIIITMYFNAGLIPWYLTMRNLSLTNNFLAYVLPSLCGPFNMILVKTYIESIPASLEESSEVDGAGYLKRYFWIILPLAKPILATIAIFSAVGQWNSFMDTVFLMTKDSLFTLQFILYKYLNSINSLAEMMKRNPTFTNASAATMLTPVAVRFTVSVVTVIPILLVYPFFQRFFVKGIMIGAVKG